MNFTPPYYCSECKLIVSSLEKLLFIDDTGPRGFCSETCIEDHFYPIMRHFEKKEGELRARLSLEKEKIDLEPGLTEKEMTETVLARPSEVWSQKNQLGEELFTYVKHFSDFSAIIICSVYRGSASFVYLNTKTRSKELINAMRPSKEEDRRPSENISEAGQDELSEEDLNFLQLVESKKSNLLAELLNTRSESDISFEEFNQYEFCYQQCLDWPDEVFVNKDKEGDSLYVYIKSFIEEDRDFFYIVSCLKKEQEDETSISVIPVLAFPTNDIGLYSKWRTGKKIAGQIKN